MSRDRGVLCTLPDGTEFIVVHARCPELSEYPLVSTVVYMSRVVDGQVDIAWTADELENLRDVIDDWLKRSK